MDHLEFTSQIRVQNLITLFWMHFTNWQVQSISTPAYHPQSNELIENANKTRANNMKEYVR